MNKTERTQKRPEGEPSGRLMLMRYRGLTARLPASRAKSASCLRQRFDFAFDQAGMLVLPGEVGLAVEHLQGVGNGVVC